MSDLPGQPAGWEHRKRIEQQQCVKYVFCSVRLTKQSLNGLYVPNIDGGSLGALPLAQFGV